MEVAGEALRTFPRPAPICCPRAMAAREAPGEGQRRKSSDLMSHPSCEANRLIKASGSPTPLPPWPTPGFGGRRGVGGGDSVGFKFEAGRAARGAQQVPAACPEAGTSALTCPRAGSHLELGAAPCLLEAPTRLRRRLQTRDHHEVPVSGPVLPVRLEKERLGMKKVTKEPLSVLLRALPGYHRPSGAPAP